ncbi:hypothetical protein [Caballeronia sp. DA-9]|uniref:hypothetical protein n=1 Tax=Caballeronia sp. DA-9 TaxID=3436237 RepID=UPI003F672129
MSQRVGYALFRAIFFHRLEHLSSLFTVIQLLPFHLPYAMTVSPSRLSQPEHNPGTACPSTVTRQFAARARGGFEWRCERVMPDEVIGSFNAAG